MYDYKSMINCSIMESFKSRRAMAQPGEKICIDEETEGFEEFVEIINLIDDKIYRVYDENMVIFCLECLKNFETLDEYREYVKNDQNPIIKKLAIVRMVMDEFGC